MMNFYYGHHIHRFDVLMLGRAKSGICFHMHILVHEDVFLRASFASNPKGDVWFIHGYGESGLSFLEAFNSPMVNDFNLYVPDLPGFGVSPPRPENCDQKQTSKIIHQTILKLSQHRPLFLVGHSQGGLIATWLSRLFEKQVKAYVNVEGNLTDADVTFSGQAATKDKPEICKTHILNLIRNKADSEESFWRYSASLQFASAESLLCWAKAGIRFTGETKSGDEYAELAIPKLYLWGRKSCPQKTKDFLIANNLKNFEFKNSHHWPMINESKLFYEVVTKFLLRNL